MAAGGEKKSGVLGPGCQETVETVQAAEAAGAEAAGLYMAAGGGEKNPGFWGLAARKQ